jgi:hypothetical protein
MIIFILFTFVFTLPLWMFGVPLYLAAAIRRQYPHAVALSAALVMGAISTLTSLGYRQCQIGMRRDFDQGYLALLVYRGFPFSWVGWGLFDASAQPVGHLFLDLLIWSGAAYASLHLFSLVQFIMQVKVARADKILIVGALLAMLPLLLAGIAGGQGC